MNFPEMPGAFLECIMPRHERIEDSVYQIVKWDASLLEEVLYRGHNV
jgi:hypothetical protein